jgi:NAD(P)-dependent dehydrogenase (short-subunit alcohol dehydrogenase family)
MKKYLVIGGSSGIGAAITDLLALEQHEVFATYNTNLTADYSSVQYHRVNVLDEQPDLSFLSDELDGVVYCPGSITLKPFGRFTIQDFEEDYRLQVLGAVRVIQSVLPKLKKSIGASIVLFSTIAVQKGFPFHSMVAASKGAVEGMTRALAVELAPGIRVNCIAPSITNTTLANKLLDTEEKRFTSAQRHPLKKIGEASDVASLAAFLLSDRSSWMTGQIIHIDGGLSA